MTSGSNKGNKIVVSFNGYTVGEISDFGTAIYGISSSKPKIVFDSLGNMITFNNEPKSEEEMFKDFVREGASYELPKERAKRIKQQQREFINSKTKSYHSRKF